MENYLLERDAYRKQLIEREEIARRSEPTFSKQNRDPARMTLLVDLDPLQLQIAPQRKNHQIYAKLGVKLSAKGNKGVTLV